MNRWKLSKRWVAIWSLPFLIGSLIFYIGYRSSLSDFSREIPQNIKYEIAQAVSAAQTGQGEVSAVTNKLSVTQPEAPANSFDQDREFREELKLVFGQINATDNPQKLMDFPSPVHGEPLRNVGNYYSEAFGGYVFHAGVDYALAEGTVIRATHEGVVIFSGSDPILGQKVTLDCGEGWLVVYGSLDNLRVKKGEVVETQGALGQVGFFPGVEGEGDRPQLHYEVWHNGKVQNP